MTSHTDQRRQEAVDDFLAVLRLEPDGERWIGRTPDWGGPTVFGGVGLAMTISAACCGAPEAKRLHSLHAHFLRPLQAGREVVFDAEVLKAGRSFHLLRVTAAQGDKPAITATCSFTSDGEGYVYDVSGIPDDVRPPEDIPAPVPEDDELWPWDDRVVGPSAPREDGTRESTHRHWFRIPRRLDDDPHLHAALFAYATDWTGIGGRPLDLEGDTTGMISLDHAAWFHRPARADEWHLQDVHGLVNAGGRGTLRGVIRDADGRIVVSMAQEMLLQPVERRTMT